MSTEADIFAPRFDWFVFKHSLKQKNQNNTFGKKKSQTNKPRSGNSDLKKKKNQSIFMSFFIFHSHSTNQIAPFLLIGCHTE